MHLQLTVGKRLVRAEYSEDKTVKIQIERGGFWLSAGVGTWSGTHIIGLSSPLPGGIKEAVEEALRRKLAP